MIDKANVILTHNCNLKCLHCYIDAHATGEITDQIYKNAISIIDKLNVDKIKNIMFTGGECMLFPKLKELIKHAKKNGMNVSVFTNGMLYNEEIFNMVDSISISLEGPEEIHNYIRQNHNSYKNILKTLNFLKIIDKPTTIQVTVSNLNYKTLDFFADFLIQYLNVRLVKFVFVSCSGRAEKNNLFYKESYVKELKNKIEEFYKRTKYHIQFITNVLDEYELNNYYIAGEINFPIWFDIPENKYLFFHGINNFSGAIKDYSLEKANKCNKKIQKIIKTNGDIFKNQEFIDLETLIINALGGI